MPEVPRAEAMPDGRRTPYRPEAKEELSDEAPSDAEHVGNVTQQAEAIPKKAADLQKPPEKRRAR